MHLIQSEQVLTLGSLTFYSFVVVVVVVAG